MRDLSGYKLLGNCLVNLYEKYGVESLRYEKCEYIINHIFSRLKDVNAPYNFIPIDSKFNIVKDMISKGVFKTNASNKLVPFKQVYNYEITRGIGVVYSCDKNLTFKIPTITNYDKDVQIKDLKEMYVNGTSIEVQKLIDEQVTFNKPQQKAKIK